MTRSLQEHRKLRFQRKIRKGLLENTEISERKVERLGAWIFGDRLVSLQITTDHFSTLRFTRWQSAQYTPCNAHPKHRAVHMTHHRRTHPIIRMDCTSLHSNSQNKARHDKSRTLTCGRCKTRGTSLDECHSLQSFLWACRCRKQGGSLHSTGQLVQFVGRVSIKSGEKHQQTRTQKQNQSPQNQKRNRPAENQGWRLSKERKPECTCIGETKSETEVGQ